MLTKVFDMEENLKFENFSETEIDEILKTKEKILELNPTYHTNTNQYDNSTHVMIRLLCPYKLDNIDFPNVAKLDLH